MKDSKKILIIDDEPDICTILKRFLTKTGWDVEVAYNEIEGLKKLSAFEPHVVFCDFRLGERDGGQVLQEIKKRQPAVQVIIITGYSDIKIAVHVMKMGAFDYMTKPLFPDEISLVANKALDYYRESQGHLIATPSPNIEPNSRSQKVSTPKTKYFFGDSPLSTHLVKQIKLVAPTPYSVIIYGESGSGKEAVAREIHKLSTRNKNPFVAVDCGAISSQLAGSELFGHEKGAFTGAFERKIGHFESANGGTIFLDEVVNLNYEVQVSLLRVIQERKIRRVGGLEEIDIDVRIIVASNENLLKSIKNGKFREDLFYRFNEFSIDVPPLRKRGNDIIKFAEYFLDNTNKELGKNVQGFSKETMDLFLEYPWYGNLRELQNIIKKATLLCEGTFINPICLPFEMTHFKKMLFSDGAIMDLAPDKLITSIEKDDQAVAPKPEPISLKSAAMEAECELILDILKKTNFNKSKAAILLSIDRKTLYNKMKFFNLHE